MSLQVLVIEDDREIRSLMQASLSVEGFAVQTAVSLSEARAMLKHKLPDLIVLDLGLPDGDGVQLVGDRAGALRVAAVCPARQLRLFLSQINRFIWH